MHIRSHSLLIPSRSLTSSVQEKPFLRLTMKMKSEKDPLILRISHKKCSHVLLIHYPKKHHLFSL